MDSRAAQSLAYYASADGIGVLAPRGWRCEGVSGSGGYVLFLSPKAIDRGISGWHGLEGPAIVVKHMTSENSGRYQAAEIMARAFPAYREFARRVWELIDLPFPSGPYPNTTLTYRGKTTVEYRTPAQTDGLGNFDSWLEKNNLPIKGAAIIVGDPANLGNGTDVVLLSVRLPPRLAGLIPAIVGQFERDAGSYDVKTTDRV